jgi:hypothetical protein
MCLYYIFLKKILLRSGPELRRYPVSADKAVKPTHTIDWPGTKVMFMSVPRLTTNFFSFFCKVRSRPEPSKGLGLPLFYPDLPGLLYFPTQENFTSF